MTSSVHKLLHRDIVVIGGSSGSVAALRTLVSGLPPRFPAAVFVAVHTSPTNPGALGGILDRSGPLAAALATDRQPIRKGRIFVAPPDHHLVLEKERVRVVLGPKENGFRPAVDPLFNSAACEFGKRVIGIILTGSLDDGSQGLVRIKKEGGLAVVQDPEEAFSQGMPLNAIRAVEVDHVVPVRKIAPLLIRLVREPISAREAAGAGAGWRGNGGEGGACPEVVRGPSGFTCPECGGALWERGKKDEERYRCRVGHTYSPKSLLLAQDDRVEAALWSALRALQESAAYLRRMAQRAREMGLNEIAAGYERKANEADRQGGSILAPLRIARMGKRGEEAGRRVRKAPAKRRRRSIRM